MNIGHILRSEVVSGWVTENLSDALALELSRAVANSIRGASFEYRVFAGESRSEAELLDFSHGGKVDVGQQAVDWLVETINSRREVRSGFWMLEDWIARPSDLALVTYSMPVRFCGEQVFYTIDNFDPRTSASCKRAFANKSPLFHGFLINGLAMPMDGRMLRARDLEEIASHVSAMFFGVYDGESYLACLRG